MNSARSVWAAACVTVMCVATGGWAETTVLRVDPTAATGGDTFTSLRSACERAVVLLKAGTAVTIRMEPGVYRETLVGLDFCEGRAKETPLTIEAASLSPGDRGAVIWSGAAVVTPEVWKEEGDGVFSMPWPHGYGNRTVPWGPAEVIGHRSEMLMIDGVMQRQVLLETYTFHRTGQMNDHHEREFGWEFGETLDPKKALKPGEFGVIERDEDPRLYFRPREATKLGEELVEVARLPVLADFGSKQHLTLRGLTIQHARTPLEMQAAFSPLVFGEVSADIALDRCTFRWNNNCGLRAIGDRWSIRHCRFLFNGYSGLNCGRTTDSVLEHNETSYNNWRGIWAGQPGFFVAGVKIHRAANMRLTDHLAVGNLAGGVWFDIDCRDVTLERVTAIGNHHFGMHLELSNGPFSVRDALLAHNGQFGLHLHNLGVFDVSRTLVYHRSEANWPAAVQIALRNRKDSHAQQAAVKPGRSRIRDSWFVVAPDHRAPIVRRQLLVPTGDPWLSDFGVAWRHVTLGGPRGSRVADYRQGEERPAKWLSFKEWTERADVAGCEWKTIPLAAPDELNFTRNDDREAGYPFIRLDANMLARTRQFHAWALKGRAFPEELTDGLPRHLEQDGSSPE